MRPEEIKPDTQLCTIMGYNAQTGYRRRYFNKWLKQNSCNATAIALNITDDHFEFTMRNVAKSKVDRMILENEFAARALEYCDEVHGADGQYPSIDFIEIAGGRIVGYDLDAEVKGLFGNSAYLDERIALIARMMLIARRWYGIEVDIDAIPLMIEKD